MAQIERGALGLGLVGGRNAQGRRGDAEGSILVVDDDIGTRSLVVDAICQAGAYAVTEASDGVEGLESDQFDHGLSDLRQAGEHKTNK